MNVTRHADGPNNLMSMMSWHRVDSETQGQRRKLRSTDALNHWHRTVDPGSSWSKLKLIVDGSKLKTWPRKMLVKYIICRLCTKWLDGYEQNTGIPLHIYLHLNVLAGVPLICGRLRVTLHFLQLNICLVFCFIVTAANDISVPWTINSLIIFVIIIVIVHWSLWSFILYIFSLFRDTLDHC